MFSLNGTETQVSLYISLIRRHCGFRRPKCDRTLEWLGMAEYNDRRSRIVSNAITTNTYEPNPGLTASLTGISRPFASMAFPILNV